MPTEQTDVTKKPLIFVSHSSKDKLIADAICARLENQGIRCWIAPRDVDPGRDYSNQIAEALENSSVMVMVVSSGANSSRHVKSEIDRAFSLGQIIIPFRVENIELDKGLAYYLSKTHWLDAVSPPLEQHIDHLAVTIRKISNQDLPPAAPGSPLPAWPRRPTRRSADGEQVVVAIVGGHHRTCRQLSGILGFLFLSSRHEDAKVRTSASIGNGRETAPPPPISPSASTASVADQPSIEGIWTITEARTLEGSSYGGTVEFIKQGDRYQVMWRTSAGTYSGLGLMRGNKLCVGWSPELFGVVFYKIGGDGTLNGKWTVIGATADQSDGVEKATGGNPGRIEGRYVVTGTNPGSQAPYGGQLEIMRTGATYLLNWKVGNSSNTGVAIKVDDDLFAAWADKKHAFGIVSYTFEGGRAKGVWTLGGSSRTATEDLVKP